MITTEPELDFDGAGYHDPWPPEVATLFLQLSQGLFNGGMLHYSADAVLHRIRWHYHVEKQDRTFKANNNWTAGLARWAMNTDPRLEGFFRTREAKL